MRQKKKTGKALEMLLDISRMVSYSRSIEQVADSILKQVKFFLDTDYSALFLLDENSHQLILAGARGFSRNQIENLKILGSWERINAVLVKKGAMLAVNSIGKNAVFKGKKLPFARERLPLGAFLAVPLKMNSTVIGALIVSDHRKRRVRFNAHDKRLLYTLANLVSIAILNTKLSKDLKGLFLNTITSLITAVDAKDPYTHGHSERVALYATAIAKEMKASSEFLEGLRLSGILHDVGKIGISDNILSKTDALNEEETKKMRMHPTIGARIVQSVIKARGILSGIAEHHERYDGKGYPGHLKKNEILLEGRIIAVADAFDTLTTNRPYKKAFTAKEALFEILRSAKTQFDPKVVKAFQKSFSKLPEFWHFK